MNRPLTGGPGTRHERRSKKMKRYPDSVYQMYEIIFGFTEEMESLLYQLQIRQEEMFKKINALMETASTTVPETDTQEMVRQALDDGSEGA
jgi:hypothetical protein